MVLHPVETQETIGFILVSLVYLPTIMDTKSKILQVADQQYHKYGIRSVSMDDIARELGMSKKTIYQFYKDKNELVKSVAQLKIDQEKQEFNQILKVSKNAIDELFQLSKCLRNNLHEMNPSLLFDLQKFHSESWELWVDFKNDFIKNAVLNVIERGKKDGCFRPEINAEIMAIYRIETIQLAFDQTLFPKEKFELASLQLELFDHFVFGLLSTEGRKQYEQLRNSNTNEQ